MVSSISKPIDIQNKLVHVEENWSIYFIFISKIIDIYQLPPFNSIFLIYQKAFSNKLLVYIFIQMIISSSL